VIFHRQDRTLNTGGLSGKEVHDSIVVITPYGAKMHAAYKLLDNLSNKSKMITLAVGLASMILLALIDLLTGYEISFALFYVIPVSLIAWFVGISAGLFLAFASAALWQLSNILAGETFSNDMIPIWNASTRLGFFAIVVVLLNQLKLTLEQERKLSRTDYLTGALNRRAFYELLEAEILRSKRYHSTFTIAYIDLDNFKKVNDEFGHSTGDIVLRNIVEVIHSNLRSTDHIARLGGDEFAILLLEPDGDTSVQILMRLQQSLGSEMEHHQWPVTFSMGGLVCTKPPKSADDLIHQADQLMYTVKNTGKSAVKYSIYSP
jgi:diguanylate cyclase (GGDEF)-like protein